MSGYEAELQAHYEAVWKNVAISCDWPHGSRSELPESFRVLEFGPKRQRPLWTYATSGMSHPSMSDPIELHLLSPERTRAHVELLTVIAHYHRTSPNQIGLGDTVNFGRPWLPRSRCTHGLISLPYLDGPSLEVLTLASSKVVRLLWLVPITPEEVAFKKQHGLEALESRLEKVGFNYADPMRASVA